MGNQQAGLNYSLSTSDMDSGFEESSSTSSQHSSPHLVDNSLLRTARFKSASSFHFDQLSNADMTRSDESKLSPLTTSTPISSSNAKLSRFRIENKPRSSSSYNSSTKNNINLSSSDSQSKLNPSTAKENRTKSISIQRSKADNRTISEEAENEDDYLDSDEHLDDFNSNEVFVDTNSDACQMNESIISVSLSLNLLNQTTHLSFSSPSLTYYSMSK